MDTERWSPWGVSCSAAGFLALPWDAEYRMLALGLKETEIGVCKELISRARPDTGYVVWCPVEVIARRRHLTDSAVHKILSRMAKAGWLRQHEAARPGRCARWDYQPLLEAMAKVYVSEEFPTAALAQEETAAAPTTPPATKPDAPRFGPKVYAVSDTPSAAVPPDAGFDAFVAEERAAGRLAFSL